MLVLPNHAYQDQDEANDKDSSQLEYVVTGSRRECGKFETLLDDMGPWFTSKVVN